MKKTALITGGTKGIGKAIVAAFAERGFDIVACARNSSDLETLKTDVQERFGVEVHTFKADVSQIQQVKEFISGVKKLKKPIDVIVNNAGVFIPGQMHQEEEGALEKMIETNLYSAYHITRGFIHELKEKKAGHVFNICSTASTIPYANGGSYCISKFAMLGMSKVLREEMKEYDVRVTAVMPGATLTASWDGVDLPDDRFMKAEDVAAVVWNAYEMSDRTVIEEITMRPQLGDI